MNTGTKIGFVMSLLLATVAASGQTPPKPIKIEINSENHYADGYNKGSLTKKDPNEDPDSVMVGATMHYFVMPDTSFNREYGKILAAKGDTVAKTTETASKFTWSSTLTTGAITPINPNSTTSTSPHVTVEWTNEGAGTLKMVENPKEYKGKALPATILQNPGACKGERTISVEVIKQPLIEFGTVQQKREDGRCEDGSNTIIELPLNVTTYVKATQELVKVYFTVQRENGVDYFDATNGKTPGVHEADVTLDATNRAKGTFTFDLSTAKNYDATKIYDVYKITIVGISDRISRKCNIQNASGTLALPNVTNGVFTYVLMTAPKPGEMYHIPNNY
jgi:hypothetical protein